MRKIIVVVLAVFAILGAQAYAAGKTKAPPGKGASAQPNEIFDALKSMMATCQSMQAIDNETDKMLFQAKLNNKAASNGGRFTNLDRKRPTPPPVISR